MEEKSLEAQLAEAKHTIVVLNERLLIGEVAEIREERQKQMISELRRSLCAMEAARDAKAAEVERASLRVQEAKSCIADALAVLKDASAAISSSTKELRDKLNEIGRE